MAKRPSRIELLELDIDLRLADLWGEACGVGEWPPTKHEDVNGILDREPQLLVLHAPRWTDAHPYATGSYCPSGFRFSFRVGRRLAIARAPDLTAALRP